MKRVTGIGDIFFKAKDAPALQAWYKRHLGIDVQTWGGAAFTWTDAEGKPVAGTTAWLIAVFRNTAARMSAFNAFSSILSPSWKSMARLVLPSRLELKRPDGSWSEAPLAKVSFTTLLYVSPVQMIPACDHTGTPNIEFDGFFHFNSSTTSGSASRMRLRT